MRCSAIPVPLVALVLAVFALTATAQTGPSASRIWTQVHGTVERIEGTQLVFRMNDGRRLLVDLSPMNPKERAELAPGDRTTLYGYPGERPNQFVAWFLPVESVETAAQASPATAPSARGRGGVADRPGDGGTRGRPDARAQGRGWRDAGGRHGARRSQCPGRSDAGRAHDGDRRLSERPGSNRGAHRSAERRRAGPGRLAPRAAAALAAANDASSCDHCAPLRAPALPAQSFLGEVSEGAVEAPSD